MAWLISRRSWLVSVSPLVGLMRHIVANPCTDQQALRHKMQALLDRVVGSNELPGIVALAARSKCQPVIVTSGWRDVKRRIRMTEDSIFDVRSITKPVTALAALVLVDRKRLHLDAPITESLPEARSSKWAHKVTLRHLLTHTSGLGHERPAHLKNLTEVRDVPLRRVARAVLDMSLEEATGASWRYSSPAYCLVGRLIEVAAQTSFANFVTNAVLRPLAMRDTSFLPPRGKRNRLASLYEWKESSLVPWPRSLPADRWTYEGPDFGLYSTVRDLARLVEAMCAEDFRLFQPSLRRVMLNPTLSTDVAGFGQGLGWIVAQSDEAHKQLGITAHCFGHNGAGGSMVWGDPVSSRAAVFLTQCFFTPSTAGPDFIRLAFQA